MELVRIFWPNSAKALLIRDAKGENILFQCARDGSIDLWRQLKQKPEFFKARGMQDYQGRSIEHMLASEGKLLNLD
jgi:hypothetical protein